MPPIPIHKNDPIIPVAAKPESATPQTADTNLAPTRTTTFSHPASTTSSADSDSNPPPPQPGARPVAPTASFSPTASSTPPAPQPGYAATHVTTTTHLAGPPSQYTLPPPSDTYLSGRSTTTSTTASKPGPSTLNFGPATSQYQNEYAALLRADGEEERRRSLEHPPGYQQGPDNSPYTMGATVGQHGDAMHGGVGGTAWGLLNKAGEALKTAEEAAWKVVRNK